MNLELSEKTRVIIKNDFEIAYDNVKWAKGPSLVVTRAPVAPQVLGSTPRGSEFLRI
jgi:hypothetical protein